MTDGGSYLKIVDATTWESIRIVPTNLEYINELEMIPENNDTPGISNFVFANAFYTESIHMINIHTGAIVKEWDFTELLIDQLNHVG